MPIQPKTSKVAEILTIWPCFPHRPLRLLAAEGGRRQRAIPEKFEKHSLEPETVLVGEPFMFFWIVLSH